MKSFSVSGVSMEEASKSEGNITFRILNNNNIIKIFIILLKIITSS